MRYSWLIVLLFLTGCIPLLDDSVAEQRCVVERVDTDRGRMSNRWVFIDGRLAAQRTVRGPGTASEATFVRDRAGRLVRESWQTTQLAGSIPEWFAWNSIMVRYETPIVRDVEVTYRYDERGNPAQVTRSKRLTTTEQVHRSQMSYIYEYDDLGRKTSKTTVYRDEDSRDTNSKRYTYRSGRLYSMETELSADLTTRTVFTYDSAGRPNGYKHEAPSSTTEKKLEYDEDGNLTSLRTYAPFEYDAAGRLISEPIHGARFEYDGSGRLSSARYPDGSGYRMQYSSGCSSEFSHPAFTPHSDYHIYYEGPYEYRLTLPPSARSAFLMH
ncbi:MAG: RHS repeat domain-containing protein [Myxococcota bacterium]